MGFVSHLIQRFSQLPQISTHFLPTHRKDKTRGIADHPTGTINQERFLVRSGSFLGGPKPGNQANESELLLYWKDI
jgi:hypothetical protein